MQFFTELRAVSRAATAYLDDPRQYRNPWGTPARRGPPDRKTCSPSRSTSSAATRLAFLLVRPVKEARSFTAALKSVERCAASWPRPGRFPGLDFGLTGMPVLETDEMAAAEHDTQLASWLAIACVALLFLWSIAARYPLLTVVTLLVGTAWRWAG